MCIKIVERYAVCRCIYYSHDVDYCPAYGRRGHGVKTQEVLVGYTCSRHSISIGSEEPKARNAQGRREDNLEKNSVESTIAIESTTTVQATTSIESATTVEPTNSVESAIHSPLRDRLLAKLQNVLGTDDQFIPAGDLDEVLTSHAIEDELESYGLNHLSSIVFLRARKIFAILLVIGKLDALQDLIKEEIGDVLLPLANSATNSLEDNKPPLAFSKWDSDTRQRFFEIQWTLLAPVFLEGKHLKLDDDARLPFTHTEPIANGAFGGVHSVEIHRDHARFFEDFGSPVNQKVSLILQSDCRWSIMKSIRVMCTR